jgi:hypothetical protein
MKPKLILCLALVLSGMSDFAFAFSLQIKPGDPHPDIVIHSWCLPSDEIRSYMVFVMPDTNYQNHVIGGRLELKDGDKRLASCPIAALNVIKNPLNPIDRQLFRLIKPPVGAKVFRFEVATNLLNSSIFLLGRDDGSSNWFFFAGLCHQ